MTMPSNCNDPKHAAPPIAETALLQGPLEEALYLTDQPFPADLSSGT